MLLGMLMRPACSPSTFRFDFEPCCLEELPALCVSAPRVCITTAGRKAQPGCCKATPFVFAQVTEQLCNRDWQAAIWLQRQTLCGRDSKPSNVGLRPPDSLPSVGNLKL